MANVLKSRQKETMQSFKTPRNKPMMSDLFKTKQKETISSSFNKTDTLTITIIHTIQMINVDPHLMIFNGKRRRKMLIAVQKLFQLLMVPQHHLDLDLPLLQDKIHLICIHLMIPSLMMVVIAHQHHQDR